MLDWDTALSHHGNSLMAARIAMYDEDLWVDLFRASRALRQYAEQHADQRQASANLKLVVGTIFSPLLQELYLQHEAHAFVAELLRTLVSLGRDHPEIICQMADEGIFYVLSVMALYPPTSEVTLASLAKLANCEGQAGWEAQVAIMSGAMAQHHAPPPLLASESSAMAAEAKYEQSSCLPVVYKMLTAEDKASRGACLSPRSSHHTPHISLSGGAAGLSRPEPPLGLELPESSQQLKPSQSPESPQQPATSQGHKPVATLQDPKAIQALQAATELWREKPDRSAEEAMQGLSHFPAVVQALVQAVHTSAASEAVQILSTLSQQGGDVGAVLGSAGAAEAIVRATLINEDIGHFKSHKELSDLVVTVLPHPDSAVQIIQMCKTAILESSSSFIRHRALGIMRAVTAWLEAADAAAHGHMSSEAATAAAYAAVQHESQHAGQPQDSDTVHTLTTAPEAVAAAASTVSKRSAESATSVTPTGAGLAREFLNSCIPSSSQSAVPVSLSECQQLPSQSQQEYQQIVAAMTQSLLQQHHHHKQQQQQQQQPALIAEEPAAGFAALEGMRPDPDASTPSTPSASSVLDGDAAGEGVQAAENAAADGASDVREADEADAGAADADAEQLAAAERQRIVDEAVERLFEASAGMLPVDHAADSARSKSETDRGQQGRSGGSGSEQFAHSSRSRNAADSAAASASGAADTSAATSGEGREVQEEEEEGQGDRELAGVLNTPRLQGVEGPQAAVQSVLLPSQASSVTLGELYAPGKGKMVQQVPEQSTEQVAAPGSSSDTPLPDAAVELPQGADAQSSHTDTRAGTQGLLGAGHPAPASALGQARGLPPLTPARVHSTAQQGAAVVGRDSWPAAA
ncbi:hypothetical protein WJX79_000777 [Trebouxia sp. C0005]